MHKDPSISLRTPPWRSACGGCPPGRGTEASCVSASRLGRSIAMASSTSSSQLRPCVSLCVTLCFLPRSPVTSSATAPKASHASSSSLFPVLDSRLMAVLQVPSRCAMFTRVALSPSRTLTATLHVWMRARILAAILLSGVNMRSFSIKAAEEALRNQLACLCTLSIGRFPVWTQQQTRFVTNTTSHLQ